MIQPRLESVLSLPSVQTSGRRKIVSKCDGELLLTWESNRVILWKVLPNSSFVREKAFTVHYEVLDAFYSTEHTSIWGGEAVSFFSEKTGYLEFALPFKVCRVFDIGGNYLLVRQALPRCYVERRISIVSDDEQLPFLFTLSSPYDDVRPLLHGIDGHCALYTDKIIDLAAAICSPQSDKLLVARLTSSMVAVYKVQLATSHDLDAFALGHVKTVGRSQQLDIEKLFTPTPVKQSPAQLKNLSRTATLSNTMRCRGAPQSRASRLLHFSLHNSLSLSNTNGSFAASISTTQDPSQQIRSTMSTSLSKTKSSLSASFGAVVASSPAHRTPTALSQRSIRLSRSTCRQNTSLLQPCLQPIKPEFVVRSVAQIHNCDVIDDAYFTSNAAGQYFFCLHAISKWSASGKLSIYSWSGANNRLQLQLEVPASQAVPLKNVPFHVLAYGESVVLYSGASLVGSVACSAFSSPHLAVEDAADSFVASSFSQTPKPSSRILNAAAHKRHLFATPVQACSPVTPSIPGLEVDNFDATPIPNDACSIECTLWSCNNGFIVMTDGRLQMVQFGSGWECQSVTYCLNSLKRTVPLGVYLQFFVKWYQFRYSIGCATVASDDWELFSPFLLQQLGFSSATSVDACGIDLKRPKVATLPSDSSWAKLMDSPFFRTSLLSNVADLESFHDILPTHRAPPDTSDFFVNKTVEHSLSEHKTAVFSDLYRIYEECKLSSLCCRVRQDLSKIFAMENEMDFKLLNGKKSGESNVFGDILGNKEVYCRTEWAAEFKRQHGLQMYRPGEVSAAAKCALSLQEMQLLDEGFIGSSSSSRSLTQTLHPFIACLVADDRSTTLPFEILPLHRKYIEVVEDGMENVDWEYLARRFPNDLRAEEVRRMLAANGFVKVVLPNQRPEQPDSEVIREKEQQLLSICQRTLALPVGRALFTYGCLQPRASDVLGLPPLTLSGRSPPANTLVDLSHIEKTPNMSNWPLFHNAVAAGLQVANSSQYVDWNWILLNLKSMFGDGDPNDYVFPELNPSTAGFLLGLGLNGHFKHIFNLVIHELLSKAHELTTIAVLLGWSCSCFGTADMTVLKVLSIHLPCLLPPTTLEIQTTSGMQAAALVGVGLLYLQSGNRQLAQVMLDEIHCPPVVDRELKKDRESHALSAGFAMGFILLGHGNILAADGSLSGQDFVKKLTSYVVGGVAQNTANNFYLEGNVINLFVTAPGAIVALSLIFLNCHNEIVADTLCLPDSLFELEAIPLDQILLRVVGVALIYFDAITPSKEWLEKLMPESVLSLPAEYEMVRDDYQVNCALETLWQVQCYVVAGACFAVGLRFASSHNAQAAEFITAHADRLLKCLDDAHFVKLVRKSLLEHCLDVVVMALALVMAGSGHLPTLRLLRFLRKRVGLLYSKHVHYGTHMAISTGIGLLFLGHTKCGLRTDPTGIAIMYCALYPIFPVHSNDNRFHLQALRHLITMVIEPRSFNPILKPHDSLRNMAVRVSMQVEDIKYNFSLQPPCLLPELRFVKQVELLQDGMLMLHLLQNDLISIVKHGGSFSFHATNSAIRVHRGLGTAFAFTPGVSELNIASADHSSVAFYEALFSTSDLARSDLLSQKLNGDRVIAIFVRQMHQFLASGCLSRCAMIALCYAIAYCRKALILNGSISGADECKCSVFDDGCYEIDSYILDTLKQYESVLPETFFWRVFMCNIKWLLL